MNDAGSSTEYTFGEWNREYLYEYLVWINNRETEGMITDFFARHTDDEQFAGMLFDFLLSDRYDGSDSQHGAAIALRMMDRSVLKKYKPLLLQAQQNEVFWKRPFGQDELDWQ